MKLLLPLFFSSSEFRYVCKFSLLVICKENVQVQGALPLTPYQGFAPGPPLGDHIVATNEVYRLRNYKNCCQQLHEN